MSLVAATRPDAWNYPLLLHVLGAMILVGAVATAGVAAVSGARSTDGAEALGRFSFRALLWFALPAYIAMRIGAEWIRSKEFGDADEPGWIGVGYLTADFGGLILLVAIVLGGLGARRQSTGLTRSAGVLAVILTIAWLVAVWAMGAKP